MEVTNNYKKLILFLPGIMFLLFIAAIGLNEAWVIGVEANPIVIQRYHFGSEAMIAHGGIKYRSPDIYVVNCLVMVLFAILVLISSLAVLIKSKSRGLPKAYSFTTISLLIIYALE